MIALLDETAPSDRGGIFYVVSAAVLVDETTVAAELPGIFGERRRRPFHWVNEGSEVLGRMLDVICENGVVSHVTVHYPTGRRRQEEARRLALNELVPLLAREGADELIIESRGRREDARDRGTLVELVRDLPAPLAYRWEKKTEPLLWIADSICGAVKQYLLGQDPHPFERLCAKGVIDELRYRNLP